VRLDDRRQVKIPDSTVLKISFTATIYSNFSKPQVGLLVNCPVTTGSTLFWCIDEAEELKESSERTALDTELLELTEHSWQGQGTFLAILTTA